MSCPGRLVRERLDPVVNPGGISSHVHTIFGGSAFGLLMDYDQTQQSKCSSCTIKEDLSNQYTPQLYYRAENGSFITVPVVGNGDDSDAGMAVYYLQRPGPGEKVENLLAFPSGFRMLTGNMWKRNFTGGLDAKAVSFNCVGVNQPETNAMPNYSCPHGLRAQIFFPICWNGQDLDSPDHRSHMSYFNGTEYNTGVCPSTHPKHMISLFYEVLYDTNRFKYMWYDVPGRPAGSHPFVFSTGDATRYGFHADFVNGWDIDVLQRATTNCTSESGVVADCHEVTEFSYDECNACKLPPVVDEKVNGWLNALLGCNPVTYGPAQAQPVNCPTTPISAPVKNYVDFTTSRGWRYAGCASDRIVDRTLSGRQTYAADMTIKKCIGFCSGPGTAYAYAGVEYGKECFCGNQPFDASRAAQPGIYGNCAMKCTGNETETCGGPSALSLYQKCSGSCENYVFEQFP
ncbi:WSC-domain-containing protein [Bimuria novae-zelandiae CBS 107.79]|uniref:WSC-domain-containing protein n=1 Tax=Bimuria novae-zelandiae CBS 107.79 TaxID=1447943 RepID=A0A6A5V0R6_9PLEO|nr:WSC-domain-containing protein [Bimuria novae-zelandiae CBS 107.79]